MLDGSGKALTGKPSRGSPEDCGDATESPPRVGTIIPPTVPPIGYVPATLAAKGLWNWIFYGSVNGPIMQPPVPPTEAEVVAASDLAGKLATGQLVIVVAGSNQPAP